ncbi:MAG: quercetin 2,3-dioxygenase [Rhodobacteraceae bacterium]|nr:quercetin 2,3-dioxygenase [Paracoccaceae bacterium]
MDRKIVKTIKGMAASDGDGVKLTRIIGSPELDMLDPFLMLDSFASDNPGDYIGGFPEHPHRGFETVTYMIAGKMRHKDNAGHEGVIEAGGVQWMTAGRGILHSEMPEQTEGLLHGFQLWVNLPAKDKMLPPAYQEFSAGEIPVETFEGGTVRVISGTTDAGTVGAVQGTATKPLYLDVALDGVFRQKIPATHNGFFYVIEGEIAGVPAGHAGILGDGDSVALRGAGLFLLIAGARLNEPVARGGPFVMNTRTEILQAFDDYRSGRF